MIKLLALPDVKERFLTQASSPRGARLRSSPHTSAASSKMGEGHQAGGIKVE